MKVKYKFILLLLLCAYTACAQEVKKQESKLSYNISILPNVIWQRGFFSGLNFKSNSEKTVSGTLGLELAVNYNFTKRFSIEPSLSYINYKTQIWVQDIYSIRPRFKYSSETINHFLEPGVILKYRLIKREYSNISGLAGNVNSFLIAQSFKEEVGKRPQTTIYQNYLHLGLEYKKQFKKHERMQWHFGLFYRNDLVDYYNSEKYDISAYPNVFYRNMLGIRSGISFRS